jgi:hypothetical protein
MRIAKTMGCFLVGFAAMWVVGSARAGMSAAGAACHPQYDYSGSTNFPLWTIDTGRFKNMGPPGSMPIGIVCPVSTDGTIGVIQYEADISDNTSGDPAQKVSCRGMTLAEQSNNQQAVIHLTPFTTDTSGHGRIIPPAGPSSVAGYAYNIECALYPKATVNSQEGSSVFMVWAY